MTRKGPALTDRPPTTHSPDEAHDQRSERRLVEVAAVEVLVWGDPDATIDAYEAGVIRPDVFTDDDLRRVVAAVVATIEAGRAPWPEEVHRTLVEAGADRTEAADLVLNVGGFEAAGRRLDGLTYRLAKVAEEADRERLQMRLVMLADRLRFPGGPARVAACLGEAS